MKFWISILETPFARVERYFWKLSAEIGWFSFLVVSSFCSSSCLCYWVSFSLSRNLLDLGRKSDLYWILRSPWHILKSLSSS